MMNFLKKSKLDIIILQYLAIKEGYNNDIINSATYKQQSTQIRNSLLYDQYLKWLVNNAEIPDSIDVREYYENNKEKKYTVEERVSVREIKVLNKNSDPKSLIAFGAMGAHINMALQALKATESDQ